MYYRAWYGLHAYKLWEWKKKNSCILQETVTLILNYECDEITLAQLHEVRETKILLACKQKTKWPSKGGDWCTCQNQLECVNWPHKKKAKLKS